MDFIPFVQKYYPEDRQLIAHTLEWIDLYDNNKYSLVLAPREHTKSTTIRKWVTHQICDWTNVRVLLASHKEQLAKTFARDIMRNLERKELQKDFGYTIGKPWTRSEAFITTEIIRPHATATLSTVAVGAGVTGERFDIIIMDDLLTVKNQRSEKNRATVKEWINSELFPALDSLPTSKWVVVGTRKNLEDWYSLLLEMPHWKSITQKLYTHNEAGEKVYLWPERFNEEVEAEKRAQMETDEFEREFMNSPIATKGLRFNRDWINYWGGTSGVALPADEHLEIYMGIDPSGGKKKDRASYSAMAVIAFDTRREKQNIYVLDMVRSKLSLPEQEDIINAKYEEWNPLRVNIEGVLYNQEFAERMVKMFPRMHRVSYKHTGMRGTSDMSKIGRIENITGWLFKHGKIYLKDPVIDPMTKTFIEHEYVQFPEGKMDLLDALNMAVDQVDLRRVTTENPVKLF